MSEKTNNTSFVSAVVVIAVILFAVLFIINQRINSDLQESIQQPAVISNPKPQSVVQNSKDNYSRTQGTLSSGSQEKDSQEAGAGSNRVREQSDVQRIQEPPLDDVILVQ